MAQDVEELPTAAQGRIDARAELPLIGEPDEQVVLGNEACPKRGARVKSALLAGIGMSSAALVAWFLLSHTARSVGAAVFFLLRNARGRSRVLAAVSLSVLSLLSFLCVTVYTVAPTQMFYPYFDKDSYDTLKSDPNAEELTVTADGGVLSGWLYHNAGDGAPLVLYFGGNGENSAKRIRNLIDNDQRSYFDGCNIAVFDYPGYGKSTGTPSEKTLKSAGLAAYDAVAQRADVDESSIVVFGYSIGTGVADYVASERSAAGLMLMAPYADGYDLYNGMVNIFHGPLRLLVAFRMESVKFAGNVAVKPLVLASESDEMVGYASSVRLSEAFPAGCTFQTIPDIGHNDFWGSQTVLQDIADYLKEVCAK